MNGTIDHSSFGDNSEIFVRWEKQNHYLNTALVLAKMNWNFIFLDAGKYVILLSVFYEYIFLFKHFINNKNMFKKQNTLFNTWLNQKTSMKFRTAWYYALHCLKSMHLFINFSYFYFVRKFWGLLVNKKSNNFLIR